MSTSIAVSYLPFFIQYLKLQKALIDVIPSQDRPDNPRPVRLLIYMDESHEMTTDTQTLPDDARNAYKRCALAWTRCLN